MLWHKVVYNTLNEKKQAIKYIEFFFFNDKKRNISLPFILVFFLYLSQPHHGERPGLSFSPGMYRGCGKGYKITPIPNSGMKDSEEFKCSQFKTNKKRGGVTFAQYTMHKSA